MLSGCGCVITDCWGGGTPSKCLIGSAVPCVLAVCDRGQNFVVKSGKSSPAKGIL